MKKMFSILVIFTLLLSFAACSDNITNSEELSTPTLQTDESNSNIKKNENSENHSFKASDTNTKPEETDAKQLVVYFSCTGNTKAVAEKIAELTGSDLYEIIPEVSYNNGDLDYNNDNCRANKEMNDQSARPAIGSKAIDISAYDTVFIGYPIWWGTMPRIINTFLDKYDLSDKTIMPFCTSGSSGISKSVSDIMASEPNADIRVGLRANGASDSSISEWLAENNLTK